jgi:hypothetical protein
MKKLEALAVKLNNAREEMRKDGKEALKEAFSEFFTLHPLAKAIVWTQYTPYFNDGDACTFSVNDFELLVDPLAIAEDVRGYISSKVKTDDEETDPFDVPYGEGNDYIGTLSRLEDTEHNRKYNYSKLPLRALSKEEKTIKKDFDRLVKVYHSMNDFAQDIVGDHCKVIVTRDGIRTEEYDHE